MKKTENDTPLYFIGPRSENRPFMAEALNLILNDHVFWRRNYHPQDPPVVSYSELKNKENNAFQENLVNELFKLMAELKFDPPFFSPRYMAHMISEPLLPGLIAYMATLFYNPNNVASEASTVTMKYELEIGKQLANLFEFDPERSFGHLTGGGTVANYQSLFYNLNLRFLPISIFLCLKEQGILIQKSEDFFSQDLERLCNLPYEKYNELVKHFENTCHDNSLSPNSLNEYTFSKLGIRGFERMVEKSFQRRLPELKIIVPASAHYSWSRGAKLTGLGQDSLVKIKMNGEFQMDPAQLRNELEICKKEGSVVVQLVCVYGTTEAGSFDPVHKIAELREEYSAQGLYFPIHVDAAYGGYFSCLFKGDVAGKKGHHFDLRLETKHRALAACESVTVDPHKLGYAPYGAGAFILKHGQLKEFVAESAEYCFSPKGDSSIHSEQIGKYILEGSKPGASAAAVYFNHKIIPLTYPGYGKILEKLAITGEIFYEKFKEFSSQRFKLVPLCRPHSNILCFFICPHDDLRVSSANLHTSRLATKFGIKDIKGIQEYEYIVSNTTISLEHFSTLPEGAKGLEKDSDKLALVRMVFMNQWHSQEVKEGKTHIELFLEKLKEELDRNNGDFEA